MFCHAEGYQSYGRKYPDYGFCRAVPLSFLWIVLSSSLECEVLPRYPETHSRRIRPLKLVVCKLLILSCFLKIAAPKMGQRFQGFG